MNSETQETKEISAMLGLYKAEWLNGKLFELFNEPEYFGELKTKRPCVLIGGRGTGKTTVLRGLSYQGQFALHNNDVTQIEKSDFYGIYYRANTNRVTAFEGPELSEGQWTKYFAHYLNLLFCLSVLEFVEWYSVQTGAVISISPKSLLLTASTLNLGEPASLRALADSIERQLVSFEASLNSFDSSLTPTLSMQGAPIDRLTQALASTETFKNKQFFFLIDEFENLLDYQQRVLNTLIKHASTAYTFKIGVRELGWRERATLNPNEQLTSPADYAHINIGDVMTRGKFAAFAEAVVSARFSSTHNTAVGASLIRTLLPRLSEDEEAELLLDGDQKAALLKEFETVLGKRKDVPVGRIAFAKFWAEAQKDTDLGAAFASLVEDPTAWKDRANNYFYSFLFTLRRRRAGIRKYYAGWEVFLSLANGNIRYLLELVHAAFRRHIEDKGTLHSPISPGNQTKAAEYVGKKNLDELQGLSVDGASLTKLLLSLGRIFQLFANQPEGHTPEVTQFSVLPTNDSSDEEVSKLLRSAVMHLALIRSPGNKLADHSDTKDYDYMVHPVFAPFFVFSYRRKRKIGLKSSTILRLVSNPRIGIDEVLEQNHRAKDALPDQLLLFGDYYG